MRHPQAVLLSGFGLGLIGVAGAAIAFGDNPSSSQSKTETPVAAAQTIAAEPFNGWMIAERQANVFTSSTQDRGSVAIAPGGEVIVVWDSRRQERGSYGVFAQRFNALGRPIGGEVHVNEHMVGHQLEPAVAIGASGATWFAWTSSGQDGSGGAIVARRFDAGLESAGGEIVVNSTSAGDQRTPAIAVNERGEALVTWMSEFAGAGGAIVMARLFDSSGTPITGEMQVSPADGARHSPPAVIAADDERFVIAWSRVGDEQSKAVVLGRVIDADSVAPTVMKLSDVSHQDQVEPSLAALGDGQFVVAWSAASIRGFDVRMRRFDLDSGPIGESQIVTRATEGWKSAPSAIAGPSGRFAVAWNAERPGERGQDIVAQIFDQSGAPVAPEFQVNRHAAGDQTFAIGGGAARAAWSDHDQLAFAWNGASAEGDSSSVNLTLIAPPSLKAPEPAPVTERLAIMISEDDVDAAIPPMWDPDYVKQEPFIPTTLGEDFGFEGVPGTGWYPPDPEMAVGINNIIVMVNGQIACFTKDGANLWRDEIENSFGFWGGQGATGFVFDPEVLYDPHTDRFFAMACERSSNSRSMFLLAVSKDDSPETAADWWKYRIDVTTQAGGPDIDSPNMAVDTGHVYLTADFFGPDKYLIYVVEKAPILSGGSINANWERITGTGQQSMGIPVMWDADAPAQYVIQSTEFTTNTQIIFHAITEPLTNYQRQTFTLDVPSYTYPNQPPQRGSGSRPFLFEPRFWSCVQRNGSLWATHHVNSGRARVRWYEFDMNNWPASGQTPEIAQWGEIDLGGTIHTYFGSINVDDAGNAALTFARSATDEYISMSRAVRYANDPPGEFRDAVIVQESTAAATGGRWGDYSFTHPDPTRPGSFWGHHEFTTSGGTGWRTWIARYDLAERLSLDVGPLFAGQNGVFDVSGANAGETVYFVYSLAGEGSQFVPQLNVTLGLSQPRLGGSAVANASGEAQLTTLIPNAARNRILWLQAAAFEGISNVVMTQVN